MNFRWPEPENEFDQKLLSDVREHGCHIIRVLGDEQGPPFAYSIGLFLNFEHPEVIVFGLPEETAKDVINNILGLVAAGQSFSDGAQSAEVLENLPVAFVSVPTKQYAEHLGFALWFYDSLPSESFPCLQVVWPDRKGAFPWQEDFDLSFREAQPVLGNRAPKPKPNPHSSARFDER